MTTFFQRLAALPLWLTLTAHVLLFAVMAVGIASLNLRNNDDADLPADDPIVQTNEKFEEIFGSKDRVLISLESEDAFSVASLSATREIASAFVGLPWVVGNEIKSLSTIKNIEASDDGLEVGTLYGAGELTPEAALRVRHHATSNPLIQGRVVSDDGRASLILINVVRESDQAQVFEDSYRILEPYREKFNVRVIGDLILSEAIDRGIQNDALVLFPLAIVLQLIILYAVFRNVRLVAASVITTVVSITWALGAQGWIGFPVTVVTTSIPILIAITAGSYATHALQTLLQEQARETTTLVAFQAAIAKIGYPLAIACLTSAVGALSLIVFKVSAIAEFGVMTSIGTVASLIVMVTLLPALLRAFRHRSVAPAPGAQAAGATRLRARAQGLLVRLSLTSLARPGWTLLAYLVLLTTMLWSVSLLRTGANFAEYLPEGHPIRSDMDYFDSHLGGSRYFDLLVEAKETEGVQEPAFLRRVEAIQAYAQSLPEVGTTLSFVDVLKRIDAVIENKPQGEIPTSFEQAAQYLLLYSISSSPEDFSDLVDYDYRRIKIFIPVKTSEQQTHIEIYEKLKAFVETQSDDSVHVEYGGNLLVWLAQMDYIIVGKIQNIIFSVLAIIVLCAVFFRSLSFSLLAAAPIALSVLCTFGLMAQLGIRLEVSTAVITGITIGFGIDFSYHLLYHYRRASTQPGSNLRQAISDAIREAGPAILFTVLVTVIGFSAFLFSSFRPIQTFGYLVGANMLFSGLATFTLIPALLAWRSRRRGAAGLALVEATHADH